MSAGEREQKIWVAGHAGMVGSAIVRRLRASGYRNLLVRPRRQLDLTRQVDVFQFLAEERPDYIFLAAAKVGGILANSTHPAAFLAENLGIALNVIEGAHLAGVQHLMFLGSSCIYPRDCPQPVREEYLLTGPLEQSNEAYAVAKIAGLKLCEALRTEFGRDYISVMPTNLYGPNDNFDLEASHVVPALIRKAHMAKLARAPLEVWGTGEARRELLFVDDLADACVFLMEQDYRGPMVNIGVGEDLPVKDLAALTARVVGHSGELVFDRSRPDGTPRKLLDVSKINGLGWRASTSLEQGLWRTYEYFLSAVAGVNASPEQPEAI